VKNFGIELEKIHGLKGFVKSRKSFVGDNKSILLQQQNV